MTTTADSICSDLDKLSIAYVECYQDILANRQILNDHLDDGYLNLSKARSLIGCSNLSLLQIPSEFDAQVFVCVTDEEKEISYKLVNVKDEAVTTATTTKLPNWFGVLTPQNLKSSHKSFFKSINMIVTLCELQSKLKSIELEYKTLIEKKMKFLSLED